MAKARKSKIDWNKAFQPVIKKYKRKKHPLDYKNRYELLVMVVLSARDSDKHINEIAPALFKAFPSMKDLAKAKAGTLRKYIGRVRNYANKTKWLMTLSKAVGSDDKIPTTLKELTSLPGIGRKSANVIIRESGGRAEGIIVDLHVLRVAPRIGAAAGSDPKKIEAQLMEKVDQRSWNDIGMALSFLGRETCRPTNPHCEECPVNSVCAFYRSMK
ncbi:MAG TPA: endonuclease III [Bacteroidota bacterium]|nr:endonuclease III [Bacteroidota bacterium]